jgi:hypothetical protein
MKFMYQAAHRLSFENLRKRWARFFTGQSTPGAEGELHRLRIIMLVKFKVND